MSTPELTVLGAGGWVGGAVVHELRQQGQSVQAVGRAQLAAWLADNAPAHVIYAIGLTADFRERPHATAEAHVGLLSRVLQRRGVQALTYLSSTRVYGRSSCATENAELPCLSSDASDLYNLSKLLGEALVLREQKEAFKVVRLSNVVGPGQPNTTFLGQLLAEGDAHRSVRILQPANTAKDYVALADVVRLLPQIAQAGEQRLYNLASGSNTSHAAVATLLRERGWQVEMNEADGGAAVPTTPLICVDRLTAEFAAPIHGLEACRALILGAADPAHCDGPAV